MSESESMSLQEESQENPLSLPTDPSVEQEEGKGDPVPTDDMSSSPPDEFSAQKNEPKESYSAPFEAFKKMFDEQTDLEAKLQLAIDFMEASLSQGGTPNFRSFWEVRRLCLPLFKENISPVLRSSLWNKYSELSKEARRLKEILDEQSAFAVEQIEIAIQALEDDLQQFDEQVAKTTLSNQFVFPQELKDQVPIYEQLQKQLNVLNVQAARINGLRKELLKTEMRVRQKNKFFQRLSTTGDHVFPKRKELIRQISQQFVNDVERFVTTHFGEHPSREYLYVLREEIKSLQGLAKMLTLNTHSFTQTRTRLSECWDKIKVEEKERKKERAQQRVTFKQNAEEIQQQIQALKESVEKREGSAVEAQKNLEQIVAAMRRVELGREELKFLRDELGQIRKLMQDNQKTEESKRLQQEEDRTRQKKEKYRVLKEQVDHLLRQADAQEAEQITVERDRLLIQVQDVALTKGEKQELERMLKSLRDLITDKKEKSLLTLSDDDRQALEQLKDVLKQRKERRQEVKTQLEVLRKAAGSSTLDFEKAMNFKIQINEEKERLEKANQGIQEIEQKIAALQSKIKSG